VKVVIVSKALIAGAAQKKLEELARLPDIDLVAVVPPGWREPKVGWQPLERRFTAGYRLETLPLALNGRHHTHFYRGLGALLARERPDVLHMDEESFNLATFLGFRAGVALGARCCFYNYANVARSYPPPFGWFERYALRHAAHALIANHEAGAIVRDHGYQGPITLLPQTGVDPELFAPPATPSGARPFTVGFVGRLLEQKGLTDLLEAISGLPGARLLLVGDGALRPRIELRAASPDLSGRVELQRAVPTTEVPAMLHRMDVMVLPSRTTPSWKEQFGRVLIEAMSCAVPVVGSSSGEIPTVLGDAGLIFPEGDVAALRVALRRIMLDATLRAELGARGRQRVLAHYTQAALARSYAEVYRSMLAPREAALIHDGR
jgi:glycosyltransferase involved in cell wall biosynthesis